MSKFQVQLGETFYETSVEKEEWEAIEFAIRPTKLSQILDEIIKAKLIELRHNVAQEKNAQIVEGYIQAIEDLADLFDSGIHNAIESERERVNNSY